MLSPYSFDSDQYLFNPEVSLKRSLGILYLINRKDPTFSIEGFLSEFFDQKFVIRILKDPHLWIARNIEVRMMEYNSYIKNLKDIVYKLGKDMFYISGFDLYPDESISINFVESLFKLPIVFSQYVRDIQIVPEYIDTNHVQFYFRPIFNHTETWYDIIMFKGMLSSCISFYDVSHYTWNLSCTRISRKNSHYFNHISTIQFDMDNCIIDLRWKNSTRIRDRAEIGLVILELETKEVLLLDKHKNNFKSEDSEGDSISEKFKELYIEKRDLEAAVEVLSFLKSELDQKQKSIEKDLRMARNIQKGIIPQKLPDWNQLRFGIKSMPMQEVSGDYYDYFLYGQDRIGVIVSDVSGHGVPAAFITAISKLLFSNYKLDTPSEIFKSVNTDFIELIKQQGYITCFYAMIDKNYTIKYSNAGHPCPIIHKHATNEVIVLNSDGTYLGMFSEANMLYKDSTVQLEPKDKVFIFTDGLTEGVSDKDVQFGYANLIRNIYETKNFDAQKSVDYIFEKYLEFCRGTDLFDDTTLLVIELAGQD